jgi:cardiolipin synthase
MLAEWVNTLPAGEPVVVAGDFNDWRQQANHPLKAQAGLEEIFTRARGRPARTFPVSFPLLRLDRIYVKNAHASRPKALALKQWRHLSDHAPLAWRSICEMSLAGRQPHYATGEWRPVLSGAVCGHRSRQPVILETFIWFEDEVGWQLHAVLLEAARRGIQEVLLDGYGSPDLSDEFVGELTAAGVIFRYYDPRPKLFGMRTNLFRRMHRKIVVIDDTTAFVGGINYSAEHMSDYGPEAKQDYAVQVEGPVVQDILQFELENLPNSETARRWWRRRRHQPEINRPPAKRRRCSSGATTGSPRRY